MRPATSAAQPEFAPSDSTTRPAQVLAACRASGETQAEIIANRTPPDSVVAVPTTNLHTGDQDQVISVYYPGLAFDFYRITDGGRDLLWNVLITGPGFSLPFGLTVGKSRSDVEAALDQPSRTEQVGDTMVVRYLADYEVGEKVIFYYVRDLLVMVQCAFYID